MKRMFLFAAALLGCTTAFAQTMKETGNVAKEYYCSVTHLSEYKLPGIKPEKRNKFSGMKKATSAPVEKAKRLIKDSLSAERDFIENAGKRRGSKQKNERRTTRKDTRNARPERDKQMSYFPTEYNPKSRHGSTSVVKKKKGVTVHYLDRDPLED